MQKLMQVVLGQWANYLSVTDSVNFICRIDADLDRSGHAFEISLSTVKFSKIPQTNLHDTCGELRILPSPLVAWEFSSRFSVDSPPPHFCSSYSRCLQGNQAQRRQIALKKDQTTTSKSAELKRTVSVLLKRKNLFTGFQTVRNSLAFVRLMFSSPHD